MKRFTILLLSLMLAACAAVSTAPPGPGPSTGGSSGAATSIQFGSPESHIAAGANAHTAATTVATVLLRNNKISVEQAKSYRAMLGAASQALDSANEMLERCRLETKSSHSVEPDPCRPRVADMIVLALDSIARVKITLDSK